MQPKISLITPTCDRPQAVALCEKWVAAQTLTHFEWIVVDGGQKPAVLTMGQQHILNPSPKGHANFIGNVLRGLSAVTGDFVIMVEDDDALLPKHFETSMNWLRKVNAAGSRWMNYYNLEHKCWRRILNSCSSLASTSFRADAIPVMQRAAKEALKRGEYHVDRYFWREMGTAGLHDETTVIGIKGIPGTPGLGIGHRPGAGWKPDPTGAKLREWLGEDARLYQ